MLALAVAALTLAQAQVDSACRFGTRPAPVPAPGAEILVDVAFHGDRDSAGTVPRPRGAGGPRFGPRPEEVSAVEALGARVVYRFVVPALRVRVRAEQLPALARVGQLLGVTDPRRQDVQVVVTYPTWPDDSPRGDREKAAREHAWEALGGEIFEPFAESRAYLGVLPDRGLRELLTADRGLRAAGVPVGCLDVQRSPSGRPSPLPSAQQSPEQVVDSAFRAIARRDWTVLRDLMDPSALDRAREEHLGMLILVAEQRRAGQAVGGGYNPREVIIGDHIATVGSTRAPRFGNATIADLAALSPAEFYVRWLDAAYGPEQAGMVDDIVDRMRSIIGSVTAEDSAWVVYRKDARWQEGDLAHITTPGSPEILPLRRVDGRWRILPNFELAHGPDITGMFDDSPGRGMQAPTRRDVQDRPVVRAGPPRHADAVPSPIVVVDSAFEALARSDWPRLAILVDPERLVEFQERAVQQLVAMVAFRKMRSADDSRAPMSGGVMLRDSDVDKAGNERVDIMRGRPTIDELRRLSPRDFFMRWCEAAYTSPPTSDSRVERRYLGTIFEGEDLAHVLYRSSAFTFDLPAQVMMMSLRHADGHWRILLNEETGGESAVAMRLLR